MANEYYTIDSTLSSIADAIRTKGGTTAALSFPTGFINAIQNLTYNPNASTHPIFTYTGTYQKTFNNDGSWELKLLTSGNLTFSSISTPIDVFLVGGGGGGASASYSSIGEYYAGAGGGGGGYTHTIKGTIANKGTAYNIQVGGGMATEGGKTVAFGVTVNGGKGGNRRNGGAGGSGGGGGGYSNTTAGGNGGSNGADGGSNSSNSLGGLGQGTTTRAFGESTGTLYAAGGGGGAGINSSSSSSAGGSGGSGGGGRGGNGSSPASSWKGVDGTANTGSGGGGSIAAVSGKEDSSGGIGGSGIVIIRNAR